MINEELVAKIKAGEDLADHMLTLWTQNKAFIAMLARKYTGYAEQEDLEQEGYLGLCQAVEHYDPDAGSQFLTYAGFWIRQAMQRYIEGGTVRIPLNVRQWHRRYKKLVRTYDMLLGRKPNQREIAGSLGLSIDQVREIEQTIAMEQIGSLNSPLSEEEDSTMEDMLPGLTDVEGEVLEEVGREQLHTLLWELVDALPRQEAEVIQMRYQEGKTRKEIGEVVGKNPNQVNHIETRALRSLGRNPQLCQSYLPENMGSHAYRHNGVSEFDHTWTSSTEWCAMRL